MCIMVHSIISTLALEVITLKAEFNATSDSIVFSQKVQGFTHSGHHILDLVCEQIAVPPHNPVLHNHILITLNSFHLSTLNLEGFIMVELQRICSIFLSSVSPTPHKLMVRSTASLPTYV